MNNDQNPTLINGVFDPLDAKEILKSMFWSKMQFHEMRNLTQQERLGIYDTNAQKRIVELKKTLEEILKIISKAEANNELLSIKAEIIIEMAGPKEDVKELSIGEAN
jgi:hypothetical protein